VSPVPTPIPTPTPTPAPLVFGVSPLIEQGQTNIELISEQEQLLEVPTDGLNVVSATFKKHLASGSIVDFGVRVGMPWSGTEIEIKIRDANTGDASLVVTRRHLQLGITYWERFYTATSLREFKIEFRKKDPGINVKVNGVEYSPSGITSIDFDFETFENVTLFVNSENRVINAAESPYFSITNFYVHY